MNLPFDPLIIKIYINLYQNFKIVPGPNGADQKKKKKKKKFKIKRKKKKKHKHHYALINKVQSLSQSQVYSPLATSHSPTGSI